MNNELEKWKECKDFPLYEVSSYGKIRNKLTHNEMRSKTAWTGYKVIGFRYRDENNNIKRKHSMLHREVAKAFVDNIGNKPYVNHIDGNKLNNHYFNLEWVTASENVRHAYTNKLIKVNKGEQVGTSKLTENEVRYIKLNYRKGTLKYGAAALSRKFNVCILTIENIIKGKTWKHIN